MEAPAPILRHDRVCNWFDELTRVAADIPTLPLEARRAVSTVLVSLRHEAEPDLTVVQARGVDDVLAALSRA
jgi:hypothetical protein